MEVAGEAAKRIEKRKKIKNAEISRTFEFVHFSVKTFGSFGSDALKCFNIISRALAMETKHRKSGEYLTLRIGIAIIRGNAASALGTLPRENVINEVYNVI